MSTLTIKSPATHEILTEVPADDEASIRAKLAAAKAAQPAWAARPLAERVAILTRFRDLMKERQPALAKATTSETGKPITQSNNELNALTGRIDFFLDNVARVVADEQVFEGGGMTERIAHEPLGVVTNISAWNYPYFVGSNVFVPALLTGNAVLYKPSEFATLTGLGISEALRDAGVPKDVFAPVIGDGRVGAALASHKVGGIFFTGSHATGARIAEAAAKTLTYVQLELGGKDPAYIADDVDVVAAAAGTADGAFYNAGQSCCAVERIYVHEKIYAAFLEAFTTEVRGFAIGDPMDEKTYLGPLTREAQIELLIAQVDDARAKGGRLLTGGARLDRPGNYFAPTVIADATQDMRLMQEESFGPIIGIQAVSSDEEALARMNDTSYGLTAAVYTKDRARAEALLAKVDAGSAYWNCCDRVSPRLPWSGRNHSGLGLTLSTHGIRVFTRPKGYHLRG